MSLNNSPETEMEIEIRIRSPTPPASIIIKCHFVGFAQGMNEISWKCGQQHF